MATKTLTISFTPSGSGAQTFSTQYRVMGASSYSVGPISSTSPIVIYGMATGVNYEGILSTACASGGNGGDVYFSTYTGSGEFKVGNNVPGSSLDMVNKANGSTLISIDSGAFPVANTEILLGNHAAYTGQIQFEISGSFGSCYGNLRVNGLFIEGINIVSSGNFLFSSKIYNGTDDIVVTLDGAIGS